MEKEEKSPAYNLFEASDNKKPISRDLMNEFYNEPSAIKHNYNDAIAESNVYDNQNPNENTAQNLNNTFYSQGEAKSVNYKAIFEKQVYYDKLLNRINNFRSFIFIFIGLLHFYNSTNESLKIEYFSNIQFLFSLMIITETLLGMLLIKLKDNKKVSFK